jgi:phage baseplate assembly protein W
MATVESQAFLGRGWAFPPALDTTGEIALVEHEADIRQAILIILETSPGERPMLPDFGVGLRSLVFAPMTSATLALVQLRVLQALTQWEPRINVDQVKVTTDRPQEGRLLIDIRYQVRATNTFYNLVYPFYLLEGRPS